MKLRSFPGVMEWSEIKKKTHTPASTKGLDIHSFHQKRLSMRLHKGSTGKDSVMGDGELLPSLASGGTDALFSEAGSAPSPASRSCCFRDLMPSSCLCCRERVISRL